MKFCFFVALLMALSIGGVCTWYLVDKAGMSVSTGGVSFHNCWTGS